MNKDPLISVIVPCYKVEQYLDQCISSIVQQTYTNLEIILVNDGSPDQTPQICDKWAKKDSRIQVIHKPNGGLSDARNAGLKACHGDFIAFVDSDDFIEKDMYEILYALYKRKRADVNACLIRKYIQKYNKFEDVNYFKYKKNYTTENYIKDLLRRKIDCASWNKLYTKEFIASSQFIKGRTNEDIIWLFYRFYDNNFKIAYSDKVLYNYRKGENSITTSGITKNLFDPLFNALEMEKYDKEHKRKYLKETRIYKFKYAINILWTIFKGNCIYKYKKESQKIYEVINKNKRRILLSPDIKVKEKIKSIILIYSYKKYVH